MKTLYLIDGHAMVYRAYYAFIKRPIMNTKGVDTSAIFGFTRLLMDLLRRERPTHLTIAFDPGGPTFRHKKYPPYKATRSATPEVIQASLPVVKEIAAAFRIPVLSMDGYEADDLIGTIAKQAEQKGFSVYMITPDKDYGQLVSDHVVICKPQYAGWGLETVGVQEIREKYAVERPEQIIDILALWGDASDNVPGVAGIGEVRAKKLIAEFGSVENILRRLDELPEKQREKIIASRDLLLLSKELVTIDTHVPLTWDEAAAACRRPDVERLRQLFGEYEFASLMAGLTELAAKQYAGHSPAQPVAPAQPAPQQLNLFGEPVAPAQPAPQQLNLFDEPVAPPASSPLSQLSTIATTPHRYHLVQSDDELHALLQVLQTSDLFCFDTETTGVEPMRSELVGMSFAVAAHEAWYMPAPAGREATQTLLQRFKPLFEDPMKPKVGQNVKYDILMLKQYGVEVEGFLYDTMLMHYLLDPEKRHNMTALSNTYLHYQPVEIESLIGQKGAQQRSMAQAPLEKIAEYAAEDADITWQLKSILEEELRRNNLFDLYRTIEAPLIRVLADMEFEGVKIDVQALKDCGQELQAQLVALDGDIKQMAGDPSLNISSPKQLGVALFEKLQLNSTKKTRTKQYSTDEETLQALADRHPIIPKILAFRSLRKLLSGYIESLPELVNRRTGKIHTTFNQAATSTGRLSSHNPNLQNIPIRDENGREIRKAFIAGDAQRLLLSVDYSQIELRLMAHLSEDPNMLEAFRRNEDIHAATAAKIFHQPLDCVTREQRRQAKTANFGIIYGISSFGLAQRLQIPREESRRLIEGYFATYPGVKRYMERIIESAHEHGYVSTICGRIRTLRDINSRNAAVRSAAERFAINAPIQGSAADIIKIAMIRVHGELCRRCLLSRMILQVHDELVFDVYRPEMDEVKELVQREMEQAFPLKAPLLAEMGIGRNWLDAH
ncbi:MAG: DNA polymerase I [Prevotellaceae bacterium]|jgi:DNA polymerase-1|nr:DNA polymerase I [Prevotellaceae bacterium]